VIRENEGGLGGIRIDPRGAEEKIEGERGMTVKDCIDVFHEAEWQVLQG